MRFYGNKTKLLGFIEDVISKTTSKDPKGLSFYDAFTGTTSVAQHFKKLGYEVYASDFLNLSYTLAKAHIELDHVPQFTEFRKLHNVDPIDWLNAIDGKVGFITTNYSPVQEGGRKYLSVDNAQKVDSIREAIENLYKEGTITELEKFYLVASLLVAINLVSNVSGTYGSYMKSWDKRAFKKLVLEHMPIIQNGRKNKVYLGDTGDLIKEITCDVLYLDPPHTRDNMPRTIFYQS